MIAIVNGWRIYEHPEFTRQREHLREAVERRRDRDPDGYKHSADAKLLAAITKLILDIIPADPGAKPFRQGGTLGPHRKHWFRAKFGNGRYRLFYQFSSREKVIIYAWINDEHTLRTRGARTDAYSVFKAMLERGSPPDDWEALSKAVGAGPKPSSKSPVTKHRRGSSGQTTVTFIHGQRRRGKGCAFTGYLPTSSAEHVIEAGPGE